jgi:WD40 repeat protein
VFLWDRAGNAITDKEIDAYPGGIGALAVSPDSEYALMGGRGGKVVMSRLATGEQWRVFSKHGETVLAAAFYGPELIATADFDGQIYLWDALNQKVKHHLRGQGQQVYAVAVQENDRARIAFGNAWGGANGQGPLEQVFDVNRMRLEQQAPAAQVFRKAQTEMQETQLGNVSEYELRIIRPDASATITTSDKREGRIQAYTLTQGGQVIVGSDWYLESYALDGTRLKQFVGHTGVIYAVASSADGKLFVSGSSADKWMKAPTKLRSWPNMRIPAQPRPRAA